MRALPRGFRPSQSQWAHPPNVAFRIACSLHDRVKRILLLFLIPTALLADVASKRDLIAQLFDTVGLKATVEELRKQNVELVRRQVLAENARTEFANNPIMHRLITRVLEKYDAYSHEFMGWAKWEPQYMAQYDVHFTEEQLRETVSFFKSDTGRAWLSFQAQAMVRMQQEALRQSSGVQEKIKQLMEETVAEVKAEVEGGTAN